MGKTSELESTVAALRTKDTEKLKLKAVTTDLIQEFNHITSNQNYGDRDENRFRSRFNDGQH